MRRTADICAHVYMLAYPQFAWRGSRRHAAAVRSKKRMTCSGNCDLWNILRADGAGEEAAFGGVFPHGETGARGAPSVDDVGVGARRAGAPFHKIENERIERTWMCRHGTVSLGS